MKINNINIGLLYKVIFDLIRSNKTLVKYITSVEPGPTVYKFMIDVVTINMINVLKNHSNLNSINNYLDMGCGQLSILGVFVKSTQPTINVVSADKYKDFINNARKTSLLNNVSIEYIESDLFSCIDNNKFDLISFNPPYKSIINQTTFGSYAVNNYVNATYCDHDGLEISRLFLLKARQYLSSKGCVLLGINTHFAARSDCIEMIESCDYSITKEHKIRFNTSTVFELERVK